VKTLAIILPETFEGITVYTAARRMLPQISQGALREAFECRDVKMDGRRVKRDEPARGGAEIKIYLADESEIRSIEILYEDQNLMIVNKPVGVSCEADDKGGLTVGEWLRDAYAMDTPPMPCHRLDNPTDGLLLLAKNTSALLAMETAFAKHKIHKKYVCLVRGQPSPPQAVLNAWLVKDAQAAQVKVLNQFAPGALSIITEYRVLEGGEISRLEITLHTGRTHQIRAQMAKIGHPILGDDKYGDRAFNRANHAKRLMLTATELRFELEGEYAYMNALAFHISPKF
jgi:23S rRNA pseudouridine955/2504/2580 synthase